MAARRSREEKGLNKRRLERKMPFIGNLIERLRRRIIRYRGRWSYADTKRQTGPSNEIEWNGEMIDVNNSGRLIRQTPANRNRSAIEELRSASLGTSNLVFTWLLIPIFSYKARLMDTRPIGIESLRCSPTKLLIYLVRTVGFGPAQGFPQGILSPLPYGPVGKTFFGESNSSTSATASE